MSLFEFVKNLSLYAETHFQIANFIISFKLLFQQSIYEDLHSLSSDLI